MNRGEPFAVCFSGHRPEKLPKGNVLRVLLSLLYTEIGDAIADGADTFYTGMAQGIDLWAAEMVLSFRQKHPRLRLIVANPYPEFGASLTGEALYRYQTVLHAADEVVQVSQHYHKSVFRQRNQYMVSHSRRLIAVVMNMQSGTGQTVRMAKRAGLDLRVITPEQFGAAESPKDFQL